MAKPHTVVVYGIPNCDTVKKALHPVRMTTNATTTTAIRPGRLMAWPPASAPSA